MPAFSADDGIAVVTDGDGTNIAIGDKADSRKMNGDNSISIGKSLDWPPESPDNQYHLNK
ncbi:hypothetical protein DBU07_004507 [Escherichia coli O140]|uniref:hypothetical protein n=1 Tax=Escherichia coli TaxID=562 RepID=UPI000F0B9903|nr:hypothetical protein [Escherichia coli]EEZ5766574.1 hypothetical protein [Escherichia coli O140]